MGRHKPHEIYTFGGGFMYNIHSYRIARLEKGIMKKTNELKDITVEFSGGVRLSPKNAKFIKIGKQDERPDVITGVEWQQLDDDDQGDYILEDVIAAQRDCDDGDYQEINVFVDDSP